MIFPRTTVVGSNSAGQTSHPMSHNYSRSMNEQQTCGNSNRMHFRVTARNVTSSKEKSRQNPFVHVELNTADPEKAKRFYSKLWQLEDVPKPCRARWFLTVIKVGEGTRGV
jgi:hypothetical protein